MSIKIEINDQFLAELKGAVEDIEERCNNLDPVLEPAAQFLGKAIDDSFKRSESIFGGKWQNLAPSTVERRRKNSSKPLIDTGQLRGQSYAGLVSTSRNRRSILTGVSGAPAVYGPTHQYGRGPIPARPFLPIVGDKANFESGRAEKWYKRTMRRLRKYILKGEV